MSESLPHITCPVCNMTSYQPDDVKHGYCGYCYSKTNGIVCDEKCIHKRLGAWEFNPVVNQWRGPTRPPVSSSFWDWSMRACFGIAALLLLIYVLHGFVIT